MPTRKAAHDYEVVVGNIGTVYSGRNGFEANHEYSTYVNQSRTGYGRAAGEDVTLMKDGKIAKEHYGTQENPSTSGITAQVRRLPDGRVQIKIPLGGRGRRRGNPVAIETAGGQRLSRGIANLEKYGDVLLSHGNDPAFVAKAVRQALGNRVESAVIVADDGKGGRAYNPYKGNPFEPGLSRSWYSKGQSAGRSGKYGDMYEAWHWVKGKPTISGKRITAQESFYQGFMDVKN